MPYFSFECISPWYYVCDGKMEGVCVCVCVCVCMCVCVCVCDTYIHTSTIIYCTKFNSDDFRMIIFSCPTPRP